MCLTNRCCLDHKAKRVEVIDYDGVNECTYPPVDLDDPSVLMRMGLDPAEADPRFTQQMVYAVAMKVIDNSISRSADVWAFAANVCGCIRTPFSGATLISIIIWERCFSGSSS